MENLRLSVTEFINITCQPKSTVYNWIALGKLQTEETIKGKKIIISESDLENLKVVPVQENTGIVQESSRTIPENSNQNTLLEILEKFEPYILKAGKYELLEDKQKQLDKDLDYWKEQYFSQKFQLESLQESYKKLETENQQLKNRSFFGIKY